MYSLDQVALIPSSVPTTISSRKQVNPFYDDGKLPLFAAPMTSVCSSKNYKFFDKSIPILPRTENKFGPAQWVAISLEYFNDLVNGDTLISKFAPNVPFHFCVDVANGHMEKIYELSSKFKERFPQSFLMIGNIGNPYMYDYAVKAGVDYIRVGIGGGNGCTTSVKTGIHMSHLSLIEGIKELKQKYPTSKKLPKVIADGGIDSVGKAVKCLALGYDYVMMGRAFAACTDSAAKTIETPDGLYKEYYGMASYKGQDDLKGEHSLYQEGILKHIPCNNITIKEFENEFESALRSCMSYVDIKDIKDFVGNVHYEIMSESEVKSFMK